MPVTIDTTANTLNMNDMNTPIKSSSNNSKNAISTPDTLNESFESSSSASSCSDNDTDTDSDIVSDLTHSLLILSHRRLNLKLLSRLPITSDWNWRARSRNPFLKKTLDDSFSFPFKTQRYGKCTKRPRHPSGPLKK